MRPHRETAASSELPQIQRFLQSGAELSVSAHFLSHLTQPLSVDLCHVDTRLDGCWIILECPIVFWAPVTDGPVDFSPYCQPNWKQTAGGQEKLQEDICFYEVEMERVGLFCWKWLSSCLALAPGRGPFQGLAGRVEKGGCLAVNWNCWQELPPARQFTDTAVAARADCLHPADVSHHQTTRPVLDFQTNLLPIDGAAWTTSMETLVHPCLP